MSELDRLKNESLHAFLVRRLSKVVPGMKLENVVTDEESNEMNSWLLESGAAQAGDLITSDHTRKFLVWKYSALLSICQNPYCLHYEHEHKIRNIVNVSPPEYWCIGTAPGGGLCQCMNWVPREKPKPELDRLRRTEFGYFLNDTKIRPESVYLFNETSETLAVIILKVEPI